MKSEVPGVAVTLDWPPALPGRVAGGPLDDVKPSEALAAVDFVETGLVVEE